MRAGKKQPCHGHEAAGSAGTDNEISVCSRTMGSGSYLQYFLLYLTLTVPMHTKVIVCTHRTARARGQIFGNINEKI